MIEQVWVCSCGHTYDEHSCYRLLCLGGNCTCTVDVVLARLSSGLPEL